MQLTMPKVQAWEALNDREYAGRLTMAEFYNLLVRAGYKPSVAQRAANQRGWDRLQAGLAM